MVAARQLAPEYLNAIQSISPLSKAGARPILQYRVCYEAAAETQRRWQRRNLMLPTPLFGYETAVLHLREESRHRHLGRCGLIFTISAMMFGH
jgi:hypothetical protein